MQRFIISIYKSNSSKDDVIEQLSLNFNKLTEVFGRTNEKTVLDILETLVYHYDTFTDDRFESLFNVKKDMNIREYIYKLSKYIKEKEPFASIPAKEANLLNNIKHKAPCKIQSAFIVHFCKGKARHCFDVLLI